jgi:hypothetical protein
MTFAKAHYLHLVMGEIGGVGKSWFTKLLIEAYKDLCLEHDVVDCDETTPNVGRAYDRPNYHPDCIGEYEPRKPIYFISENLNDRDLPSEIIGMAMKKDVIVNTPAQVGKVVNAWIQDSGLLAMREHGLNTICWFVGKPTNQQIEQLRSLHTIHNGELKIVFAKNNFVGHAGSWKSIMDDHTLDFLETAGIQHIDISDLRLNEEQRRLIDQEYAVFSELASPDDQRLQLHEKMKFAQYLKTMIATIIGTGLLPVADKPYS